MTVSTGDGTPAARRSTIGAGGNALALIRGGIIASGIVIATSFALLIPLAQWADEYFIFTQYRQAGLTAFADRILHWSPRPASELVLFAYGSVTTWLKRPLVTEIEILCWGSLAAGLILVPLRRAWRDGSLGATTPMVGLLLFCAFLVGHPVSEVFFWPAASIPYVMTLASVSVVFWLLYFDTVRTRRDRLLLATVLTIAAFSSEVGAFFVAPFTVLLIAMGLGAADRERGAWWGIRVPVALIVPLLAACLVFWLLAHGRLEATHELPGQGNPLIRHHLLAALEAAPGPFLRQLAFGPAHWGTSLATRILIFLGLLLAFAGDGHGAAKNGAATRFGPAGLLACAAALLFAAFATVFGAFYQFGTECCQRHSTMRECYTWLALAALAAAAAMIVTSRRPPLRHLSPGRLCLPVTVLGLGLILAGVGTAFLTERRALGQEYRSYDLTWRIDAANWRSGMSPGPAMVFIKRPGQPIVGGNITSVGHYRRGPDSASIPQRILMYFGKRDLTVIPPGHAG